MRTAWLYEAWGKNFFLTMVNAARRDSALRVVDDQRGTPTSCRALARQLQTSVEEGWRGLVHGTCVGETSWHGFAAEIVARQSAFTGKHPPVLPIATRDYPTPAKRPANSELDSTLFVQTFGYRAAPWRQRTREVVEALLR